MLSDLGAGEGHAWGCAAPALCPAGGRSGGGEWSPRGMRLAAGADAATTPPLFSDSIDLG